MVVVVGMWFDLIILIDVLVEVGFVWVFKWV